MVKDQTSRLILIDGSSFLYRAYYASGRHFSTSTGIPTSASLLITRMLQHIIERYPGSPVVAVFDAKGKSFRNEIFYAYKANRPPMPDELREQVEYVHAIVRALGLPLVSVSGVEADDVLGSYAKAASDQGLACVICTGDKDLAQLVSPLVTLYDSMTNVVYDREGVIKKYGVPPELIVDLLALKGDSSDNIPGMKGVGDKTACVLLNGIGGIEAIRAHPEKIAELKFRGSKTFAARFEAEYDTILLSYRLATIHTDVALPVPLDELKPPKKDRARLLELYRILEFRRLYAELEQESTSPVAPAGLAGVEGTASPGTTAAAATPVWRGAGKTASAGASAGAAAAPGAPETPAGTWGQSPRALEPLTHASWGGDFRLILTLEELEGLAGQIREQKLVALDTETTSLKPEECRCVGISLSLRERRARYIPLGHTGLTAPEQLSAAAIREILVPALTAPEVKIIGHNLKFDLLVLHFALGIEIAPEHIGADTMLMAYLLDSSQSVALDALALKYLNYRNITYEEVTGGRRKLNFSEVPVEEALAYSGEDAEVTLRLYHVLLPQLERIPELQELFKTLDLPFMYVLYRMECEGVSADGRILAEQSKVLGSQLMEAERQVYTAAGRDDFNIYSPQQLGSLLFGTLGIPYPKKLRSGAAPSTSEEILKQIAPDYDIANLVLRCRELRKLISTYTDKLQTMISPRSGRIYTSFNQAGTVTGRLSSSDPNLQNIPARTKEGKLIRTAFIAPQGYMLVSADYSQIELRLIAHIAEDEGLIKAFLAGHDIHKATAAEVLGKPLEEVTPQERSHAKATNFGLMYGMGAVGLRRQTGMGLEQAKVYIERYFDRYPAVRRYMEKTKVFAHAHGYVTTVTGRRIALPYINSSNTMQQKGAERAAINAPMQGSAADIIKKAMVRIQEWIETLPPDTVRMTVQVHDELLFEIKNEFVEEGCRWIKEYMEQAYTLKVPLTVSIGCAQNWGDAH